MLLKHQPRTGEHCPSPILRGWRQLHEAFLAHEMRGLVRPWLGQLSADIHWFDPQPHLLRLEDRDGRVELVHDSQRAGALFARYRAVTLRAPGHRDARPGGRPAGMNHLGRANVS